MVTPFETDVLRVLWKSPSVVVLIVTRESPVGSPAFANVPPKSRSSTRCRACDWERLESALGCELRLGSRDDERCREGECKSE